jgi:CheY-like chemotaxis protein
MTTLLRPSVLLVDCEPVLRELTAVLLSRRGARVQPASTLDEAVGHAAEQLYDVAIVDFAEGAAPPDDVVDALRDGDCLPRRLVACTSRPLTTEEARRFSVVLEKPYDFGRLLEAVFGLAGHRRPTRSGTFPRMRPTVRTPRRAVRVRRDHG